jgi:aminotransferase
VRAIRDAKSTAPPGPARAASPAAANRLVSVFGSRVGAEELAEVADCCERQWLGSGPKGRQLERELAERLEVPDLVLVNSGSNALHLALVLLDLPPGSDVVVPSFTWVACAHAVVLAGHRPVFCDVDLATQNPTAETIAAARTPATRAALVVHYAGLPAPMPEILGLGLPVVEDAAHAVDSRLAGRACGAWGDVGIYSFDAVKNLTMGEGGAVTARDPERLARARRLRYCGIGKSGFEAAGGSAERWWEHEISEVFPKLLAADLNAAVGLAQLRRLDALQAARRRVWETYQERFADLDWLARPRDPAPGDRHSYFTYLVRLPHRDRSARALLERGIYTTLRYHPLHRSPIYGASARLPNSERLAREGLNLPLHANLADDDVERVVDAVRRLPSAW